MLAFVLSGGGARGAFQAGVCAELATNPRFAAPKVLSGTSAGAINAALIASGKSPDEVIQFWLELGDEPPVTTNTPLFRSGFYNVLKLAVSGARLPTRADLRSFGWRALRHWVPDPGDLAALSVELLLTRRFDLVDRFLSGTEGNAIADTRLLRERLVRAFGGETVKTRNVALAINTVDALSHRVVRFVNRPVRTPSPENYVVVDAITVDMVLASAAVPLLFPTVSVSEAKGRHFWDGGVLVNTPMAPAIALGADTVVPILSTLAPGRTGRGLASLGDALEHFGDTLLENSYNLDRKLLLERNRVAERQPGAYRAVELFCPIRPEGEAFSAGSYLYFQRPVLEKMAALGRSSAEHWLAGGPRPDHLYRAETPGPEAPRPLPAN